MMFRHGDVLIQKIDQIPDGTKEVPRENGAVVLAHGEVTGHTHAIRAKGARLRSETGQVAARMYLHLLTSAWLRHEEHAPIELPPGQYIVKRQREYTPERLRWVAD